MEKLIINRQWWLRGTGGGKLLDPETKKMCCLGFECLRLGYTEEEILDKGLPNNLRDITKLPLWLQTAEAGIPVDLLAAANDRRVSYEVGYGRFIPRSETMREAYIATMFYFQDVEVEFIN